MSKGWPKNILTRQVNVKVAFEGHNMMEKARTCIYSPLILIQL